MKSQQLASQKKVTLPAELDTLHQEVVKRLGEMSPPI